MDQNQLRQLINGAGEAIRRAREAQQAAAQMQADHAGMRQEMARLAQNAEDLRQALGRVQMLQASGNPGIQRVENIPGRRIPFDLAVDIPINNAVNSVQQGTVTIGQEGPFVAVGRYAIFQSQFGFEVTDPEDSSVATFYGRSFGRFRPIHSAWDLNDGLARSQIVLPGAPAFPGTGAPHVMSPSNMAPFRSMQTDMRIQFTNAGSSFPRQNIAIPSAWYTKDISSPFELGALDVFERGEVLQWQVLPLHPNNPPYGNLFGFGAPNPAYPFVNSGFDVHEGISDPNNPAAGTTDPVTRVANGVLTIGFFGYRIVQPAGAGPY